MVGTGAVGVNGGGLLLSGYSSSGKKLILFSYSFLPRPRASPPPLPASDPLPPPPPQPVAPRQGPRPALSFSASQRVREPRAQPIASSTPWASPSALFSWCDTGSPTISLSGTRSRGGNASPVARCCGSSGSTFARPPWAVHRAPRAEAARRPAPPCPPTYLVAPSSRCGVG